VQGIVVADNEKDQRVFDRIPIAQRHLFDFLRELRSSTHRAAPTLPKDTGDQVGRTIDVGENPEARLVGHAKLEIVLTPRRR
jgi:hypothetical protein